MEKSAKVQGFCRFTKEKCPHLKNNTCVYVDHRVEAEVMQYQVKNQSSVLQPQDPIGEYMQALKASGVQDFGASHKSNLGTRVGFRDGRGNNSLSNSQNFNHQASQPMLSKAHNQKPQSREEILKGKPIGKQNMGKVNEIQPRQPVNLPTPQPNPKNFTRACKFGPDCNDKKLNKCLFIHNDIIPVDLNQKSMNQKKPSEKVQNHVLKNNLQNNNKLRCKFGVNCRDLKNGKCHFSHEGGQEEEVKRSGPISNLQRDYRMREQPKKNNIKPDEEGDEDEDSKEEKFKPRIQGQAKKQSRNKFFFQDLKRFLDIENDRDFIRDLSEIRGGILERINNTNLERDLPDLMIQLLERLLKQKDSEICRDFVHLFIESNFFAKLSEYISKNGMAMAIVDNQKKFKFVMTSISTMNQLMGMYQSQIDKFSLTISAIYSDSTIFLMQINDPSQKSELESATKLLLQRYQENLKAKEEAKHKPVPKRVIEEVKVDESYKNEPVQNFREVDVVPGSRELEPLNDEQLKAIRRRMPEEGDLQNPHNYLDIVFRLLHEDAISDLRNGIAQMKQLEARGANLREIRQKLKENQVKIYNSLTIQSLEVAEGARCIQFRIPMPKKHLADWRITKKLMGGSLVILSFDSFNTFVIGLLKQGDSIQRNEMHKNFGYVAINVEILKQSNYQEFNNLEFMTNNKGEVFDMIESSAYFESYRHVLLQLQQMDRWEEFPMQQFLVHGNRMAIEQPNYIQRMMRDNREEIKEMIVQMGLDNSQKDAMNHALNSNFALIQGPPGTGKTYIGVQIVKLLIKYRSYWCKKGPILLVTYTNHALEQFLTFIKDITDQIVRIGGKQSTEELSRFSLFSRLKTQQFSYGKQLYEAIHDNQDAQRKINLLKAQLLKNEYKCISTMISLDEHEGIYDVMGKLMQNFMTHLNKQMENLNLDYYTEDLVKDRIKALRKTTNKNILVLFWLGIIDLDKFIKFIIQDEMRQERKNQLLSQIDIKNNQFNDIERQIQEKIKAIQTNGDSVNDIERNKNSKENPKKKKDKKQNKKEEPEKMVYIKKGDIQAQEQQAEEEKKEEPIINPKSQESQMKIDDLNNKNEILRNEIGQLRERQSKITPEIDAINLQVLEVMRDAMKQGDIVEEAVNENEQLLGNDVVIDQDQRQLDYDDNRLSYDNDVNTLIDVVNNIIDPSYMSQIFQDAFTISECIQQMYHYNFQDSEEAGLALQKFLAPEKNAYDQNAFPLLDRWRLNNFFLNELTDRTITLLNDAIEDYERSFRLKKEIEAMRSEKFLKSQHIIAMTTTGRAKNSQMLSGIDFPIVIVEEAAEVFEAHILTSLTQNTQQVILIGDHEQLKPNPAVYELDKQYNLSMSLFERLIKNGLEHSTLSIQRRMRPEIARIMNFIYKDLDDYPDVTKYPNVTGVASNVFFFDHKFKEEELNTITSKMNVEEAKMIVRFTQYILQQKQYQPRNITILTLYAGQLLKIKKLMQENPLYNQGMRQVKVANVDNYQGEENEIIILSLVRSNNFNQIGFLKISNRVCVALSRAKHGLFIFGNSSCLIQGKKPLQLWVKVIDYLKQNNFIGDEIQVKCEQHGNVASIKKIEDFAKVPEGGCSQQCRLRLDCGHSCESVCHPVKRTEQDPSGHNSVKCKKQCVRELPCKHPCAKLCFECKSGNQPCNTEIEIFMEPCLHVQNVKCSEKLTAICKAKCGKILSCGHDCMKYCSNRCDDPRFPCIVKVNKDLPCGHTLEADCSKKPEDVECHLKCSFMLPCGHQCQRKCFDCKKTGHGSCQQKCERNLVCGHLCKEPCTRNCPPCSEICKTKCTHSNCAKICKESCDLCTEPCENGCVHSKCTRKCSEPCNNKLCNLPCPQFLPCQHPCIGLCGLKCPELCKLCFPDDPNFDENFQLAEQDVKYVLLEDCGHLFDHEFLDGWMKAQEDSETVKFKECPKCKTPIMSCARYMSSINKTLNDVNAIKALILEKDRRLQADFERIKDQLKKYLDNLSPYDQRADYFKKLYLFHKFLCKNFEFAEKQRDTKLLNQVVAKLNYLNDLFAIAKLQKQHDLPRVYVDLVIKVFQQCNKIEDANERIIEYASQVLEELRKKYPDLSFMEEIMKATDIGKNHWNKCPNGHYYAIGDCGGANQVSRCPDCHAQIGGSNHQLIQGNSFASELGGVSAWDPRGFDQRVARGEVNLNEI